MKVAMWGVGLLVLGLFGLIVINLFGNVTVTNQFNYTTMKNAVQGAMLDSLDIAHYRTGFCLCTTKGSELTEEVKVFDDKNQYTFHDAVDGRCDSPQNNCKLINADYRLDATKFKKMFAERFKKVLTNDKEYQYIIKEIIEYPPKVSIKVISQDEEFSPTEQSSGGYDIVNQIDAIIEIKG